MPTYDQITDQIEDIKKENIGLWLDVLRIALQEDPQATKALLEEMRSNELRIAALLGLMSV